jgi:hypothetical protein
MLACNKPAGWVPGPGLVVRPGRPDFARLDDVLDACLDDIVVAELDVEARSPVCAACVRKPAALCAYQYGCLLSWSCPRHHRSITLRLTFLPCT